MITDIKDSFRAMPLLMRLGFLVFGIGGATDVVFHLAPAEWHTAAGFGEAGEYVFHLVTLAGMCVTLLGVLLSRAQLHAAVRTVNIQDEEEVNM